MNTSKTFFRVIYKHGGYASADFNTIDEAINEVNRRGACRLNTNFPSNSTDIWHGDISTIQKITQFTEFCTSTERHHNKPIWDIN